MALTLPSTSCDNSLRVRHSTAGWPGLTRVVSAVARIPGAVSITNESGIAWPGLGALFPYGSRKREFSKMRTPAEAGNPAASRRADPAPAKEARGRARAQPRAVAGPEPGGEGQSGA